MTRILARLRAVRGSVGVSVRGVRWVADAATVLVFLAGLAVPLGGYLFREPVQPRTENRNLTPTPAAPRTVDAARAFPAAFEPSFNDRVGYREVLLDWQRNVIFDGLGDSTVKDVWVGRDGWLYLDVAAYMGPAAPLDPTLAAWAEVLADRHAWCESRGIVYVVAVAPEKSDVYPEYLPQRARRRPPPDYISGLRDHLRGTPVRMVDTRLPLAAAKAAEPDPVYFKLDTHWNPVGASWACAEVGRAVAEAVPGFAPTPPSGYTRLAVTYPAPDLIRMIGFPPERCREPSAAVFGPRPPTVRPIPEPIREALAADGLLTPAPMFQSDCPSAPGPAAVLIGDSFSYAMFVPFQGDFRRLTTVAHSQWPKTLIERDKPRVVIQEFVTRALRTPPAPNPPGVAGAGKKAGGS